MIRVLQAWAIAFLVASAQLLACVLGAPTADWWYPAVVAFNASLATTSVLCVVWVVRHR